MDPQADTLEKELEDLEQDDVDMETEDEDENISEFAVPAISATTQQALFGPSADFFVNKTPKKGVKRFRTGRTAGKILPPYVAAPLNAAQFSYINGNYRDAITSLSEVVKLASRLPDPYLIMATIYEECGDNMRALQFYALAASLTPNPTWLWEKVAIIGYRVGQWEQALIALTKYLRLNRQDPDMLELQIMLYLRNHQITKAIDETNKYLCTTSDTRNDSGSDDGLNQDISILPRPLLVKLDVLTTIGRICLEENLTELAASAHLTFVLSVIGISTLPENLRAVAQDYCEPFEINCVSLTRVKSTENLATEYENHDISLSDVHWDGLMYCCSRVAAFLLEASNFLNDDAIESVNRKLAHSIVRACCEKFDEWKSIISSANSQFAIGRVTTSKQEEPPEAIEDAQNERENGILTFSLPIDMAILRCIARIESNETLESSTAVMHELQMLRKVIDIPAVIQPLVTCMSVGLETNPVPVIPNLDAVSGMSMDQQSSQNSMLTPGEKHSVADDINNALLIIVLRIQLSKALRSAGKLTLCKKFLETTVNLLKSIPVVACSSVKPVVDAGPSPGSINSGAVLQKLIQRSISHAWCKVGQLFESFAMIPNALTSYLKGIEINSQNPTILNSFGLLALKTSNSGIITSASSLAQAHFMALLHQIQSENKVNDVGDNTLDRAATEQSGNTSELMKLSEPLSRTIETIRSDKSSIDWQEEIRVLETWARLLRHQGDNHSYLCVSIPMLILWVLEGSQGVGLTTEWFDYVDSFGSGTAISNLGIAHSTAGVEDQSSLRQHTLASSNGDNHKFPTLPDNEMVNMTPTNLGLFGSRVNRRRGATIRALDMMKQEWTTWLRPNTNYIVRLTRIACEHTLIRSCLSMEVMLAWSTDVITELASKQSAHSAQLFGSFCEQAINKYRMDIACEEGTIEPNKNDCDFIDDRTNAPRRRRTVDKTGNVPDEDELTIHSGLKAMSKPAISNGRGKQLSDIESWFISSASEISRDVGLAAMRLVMTPTDIAAANEFADLIMRHGGRTNAAESLLPVQRFHSAHPHSIAGMLLSAHELASRRKHYESVLRYIDAFKADPSQPLTSLCLANTLAFLVIGCFFKRKHMLLVQAMAFLQRYRKSRLWGIRDPEDVSKLLINKETCAEIDQSLAIRECSMVQEVWFNIGKMHQDFDLNHIAVDCYKRVLYIEDQVVDSMTHGGNSDHEGFCHRHSVVEEAAHNLVLIYRNSRAFDLALEVMVKYLAY